MIDCEDKWKKQKWKPETQHEATISYGEIIRHQPQNSYPGNV